MFLDLFTSNICSGKGARAIQDQELIARVLKGDQKAFQPLVTKYSSLVYSTALRITGNAAAAEDVSQEAFWQAFRSLAGFRFESSFSTWLVRIAVNKALDYCRQAEKHSPFREEQGVCRIPDAAGGVGTPTPEETVIKLEEQAELYLKLKKLPVVYRKALLDHYYNRKSYQEMAHAENISVKTVESRIYRAKKMLKKMQVGGDINEIPVELSVSPGTKLG